MDVAEGQHDIGAAGRNALAEIVGREGRQADGAVAIGMIGLHRAEAGEAAVGGDGIERAARRDVGRQNFGVPATAGGHFDDHVARIDTEKGERLGRVAVGIARDIGRRAGRRGNGGGQSGIDGAGRAAVADRVDGGRAAGGKRHGGRDQRGTKQSLGERAYGHFMLP